MLDSKGNDLTKWFQEYMAVGEYDLSEDADVIQAVNSDELDTDVIEQRIREAAPKDGVSKRFCTKCQDLFNNWPTIGGSSLRTHDSKPNPDEEGWETVVARSCNTFELEGSARAGCRFCTFLLQALKDSKSLDLFRKIETRLFLLKENVTASLSVQNWGTNPSQLLWINLPGKVCTHCNSKGANLGGKFESSFLRASADCHDEPLAVLDIASNWLSACSEGHELCKSNDGGILPTRLISIAGESLRLVLTSECPTRPRYGTLSYSWGSHNNIKLLSENLESFTKKIPREELPKTFQDAIQIAKSLGLDFLWIDAMCIIQDSEEDWQKESSLMSSVYGGSTITIAASSARDANQGCFLRPALFSSGLRARITDGGCQRVQDFRSNEVYEESTSQTYLATRAWALQEKMLPPRTIHFGDRGAFWECRTTIASDDLPDGFPRQLVSPLVRRKSTSKIEYLWPQLVRLYSAANLSFAKDKLPALSGIARLAQDETGDQYLAGLWRGQIEEQLCWRRWRTKATSRPKPWRAPSWSWASVDGGVSWYKPQARVLETEHAHVLDANTTKYGQDPFGQVTSGTIRLACSTLATGQLVHRKTSDEPGTDDATIVVLSINNKDQEFRIQIDCLDDMPKDNTETVHLVPILSGRTGTASRPKDQKDYIDELMVEGIVLQATGTIKGEYSRIGTFHFYKNVTRIGNEDEKEQSYDAFLRVLEEHGTTMAKAGCAQDIENAHYPNERYVITIV